MPSSAIVAARKYVRDALAQRLDSDVEVTYSWNPMSTAAYQVFTTRARGEHEPASMKSGRTFRNETGRFDVAVHVVESGGNVEEADEVALELGKTIEQFFADDRHPDIPGINWWVVEAWTLEGGPGDKAAVAQLIYTIQFNARLT